MRFAELVEDIEDSLSLKAPTQLIRQHCTELEDQRNRRNPNLTLSCKIVGSVLGLDSKTNFDPYQKSPST